MNTATLQPIQLGEETEVNNNSVSWESSIYSSNLIEDRLVENSQTEPNVLP